MENEITASWYEAYKKASNQMHGEFGRH